MLKNKGFTLIELIVVVAIIGVVSGIVVTFITAHKNNAEDSAVKAQIRQIAAQAQEYYIDNGSHNNMCNIGLGADPVIKAALDQVSFHSVSYLCYAINQNWAVSAVLKGGGTWCEDNSNFLGSGTADLSATCVP